MEILEVTYKTPVKYPHWQWNQEYEKLVREFNTKEHKIIDNIETANITIENLCAGYHSFTKEELKREIDYCEAVLGGIDHEQPQTRMHDAPRQT